MPGKKSSKVTKKTTKIELADSDQLNNEELEGNKDTSEQIIDEVSSLESINEQSIGTQIENQMQESIKENSNKEEIEDLKEDEIEEIEPEDEIIEINEDDLINEIVNKEQIEETLNQIQPAINEVEQKINSESKSQISNENKSSEEMSNEIGHAELNSTSNIEDSQINESSSNEDNRIQDSDEGIVVVEEETIETKKSTKKSSISEDGKEKTISVKELTEKSEIKNRIEAAMFIAGRPVSSEELSIKLDIGKKQIEDLIKELAMDYMDRITSIEIVQVGEKFSMQIKPEYTEHVKKFTTGGLIPEAVMRTLTIIALKQPISKSLVVKMRGAGAYDHIKFLIDRGFIEQSKKGRSMDLETTDQFSDTFGLSRDKKKLKEVLIQQLGIKSPVKSGDEEAEEQKARKEALNKKKEEGQPPAE